MIQIHVRAYDIGLRRQESNRKHWCKKRGETQSGVKMERDTERYRKNAHFSTAITLYMDIMCVHMMEGGSLIDQCGQHTSLTLECDKDG
jgi:hypothetical protein